MTKHEIMLRAMSLKGGPADQGRRRTAFAYPDSLGRTGSARYFTAGSGARVFLRLLKLNADTLNTNFLSTV